MLESSICLLLPVQTLESHFVGERSIFSCSRSGKSSTEDAVVKVISTEVVVSAVARTSNTPPKLVEWIHQMSPPRSNTKIRCS